VTPPTPLSRRSGRPRVPSAWRTLVVGGLVGVGLALAAGAWAQAGGQPFLWRADHESAPPIWLFGTIHVPDTRVHDLAPSVRRAFAAADRVITEIPLDPHAQLDVAEALVLPGDERLEVLLGAPRFGRLQRAVRAALQDDHPLTAAALLSTLDRLKPWAVMAQLVVLDYVPEMMEGRLSLDARLHADARQAGKLVSALETVDEQARVFDAFTLDEQVALLDAALVQFERGADDGRSPGRQLVDLYLAGDGARLEAVSRAHDPVDAALARKFDQVLLRDRNHRMADRLQALRAGHPGEALFVAVGALHLVGPDNLPALLEARGYRVTRVPVP
jgi:uncharacterized protein